MQCTYPNAPFLTHSMLPCYHAPTSKPQPAANLNPNADQNDAKRKRKYETPGSLRNEKDSKRAALKQ